MAATESAERLTQNRLFMRGRHEEYTNAYDATREDRPGTRSK